MPALGALNRSFPAVRGLIRAARPAVRSSGPAIDASMPFVRQARGLVSKPELRGLSHDLRPLVPALTALNQRSVPLYSQLSQASSCQNDVILPWTKDKIDDKTFPARGPVYEEATKPLPGLAGESRSGDANGQWFRVMLTTPKFAYPMGTDKFFLTGQPLQGVNPPTPKNHARPPLRADVPCETQQPPDLRTVPDAAPQGFDLAAAVGRRQGAGAAEDRRLAAQGPQGRGLRPEGLRRAGHGEGAARSEDGDPQARRPLRRGRRARARRGARGRLHPAQPAHALPVGGQAVPAAGRVLHRPGRHARPGPDGARLGRARRRHHQGRPEGRPRRRHAGARPRVQGPRPHRRHRAAAPQDRAQGHVHRARPGHRQGAAGQARVDAAGLQHAARRQPRRDPRLAGLRHARLPDAARRRRRARAEGARQRPARGLPALRAHAPRPGPRQRPGRPAPPEPQPARALAGRPQRRAGRQERRPRRAGRLLLGRLPLLRLRAGQRHAARWATCPARCARRPTRSAASSASPRRCARRRAPAARPEGAQPRQRRRAALRQGGGADRPEPDPALRARRAAGGALDHEAGQRAGRRDAGPDELVRRAQPPLQPRRLQPQRARGPEQGRPRGGLPVLDRVAAAQRRLAVLDLRRQRAVPRR